MANKFTKSVLERQEKEYRATSHAKPINQTVSLPPQEPVVAPTHTAETAATAFLATAAPTAAALAEPSTVAASTTVDHTAPTAITMSNAETEQTTPALENIKNIPEPPMEQQPTLFHAGETIRLDDFIIRGEGRSAKNKTFYLDTAVIQAIKQASTSQKVTESKLVNDILKKILSVK